MKPYEEMTRWELWEAMQKCQPGKEMRKIHKCLKKYNSSLPFIYRYPYSPVALAVVAIGITIVTIVMKIHL